MLPHKKNIVEYLAYIICLVAIIFGCIVSLHRFWQYEETYVDFGQYDQSLWKVSRFQEPIVYHFIHGKINVLGDHVTPSVFLISPLYWLTDRSEMILVVQAVAVGVSGIFLYQIGKQVLKNSWLALSILLAYFLFVGLQNAVITEFHELTIMTLPLMVTLWAFVKHKPKVYYPALMIMLGCKEITFSLGICIGIAMFILQKEWRKHALITMLLSASWGLLAFKVISPYFSHGQYLYASSLPEGTIGKITALFDSPIKRHTLIFSFFSFSFLPFLSPPFYLAMLQDYAARFLPANFVTRWDLGLHYNAQSAVLLAISSVYGLKNLLRVARIKKYSALISILIIINALVLFHALHGPFMLALNPTFYRQTKGFGFLNDMVKQIPKGASVMAQNNLATRFSHQSVRLLTSDYPQVKPDYILMDLREGQGPNNFFGTDNISGIKANLLVDSKYKLIYATKEQFIFQRKK